MYARVSWSTFSCGSRELQMIFIVDIPSFLHICQSSDCSMFLLVELNYHLL